MIWAYAIILMIPLIVSLFHDQLLRTILSCLFLFYSSFISTRLSSLSLCVVLPVSLFILSLLLSIQGIMSFGARDLALLLPDNIGEAQNFKTSEQLKEEGDDVYEAPKPKIDASKKTR